ncbi:hypothetical protein D3C72_2207210 [compost metagenome]
MLRRFFGATGSAAAAGAACCSAVTPGRASSIVASASAGCASAALTERTALVLWDPDMIKPFAGKKGNRTEPFGSIDIEAFLSHIKRQKVSTFPI